MEGQAPSPPETWDAFFSEFYLRAYADEERDADTAADAQAAARLAGCPAGGDLLDVPCGYGRHSIALARAGYRVVGVDRSRTLLAEARRRAGEDAPELVEADYRELPFPDERFDAAVNLFSSLGYLGDDEDVKALAEIGRVLRPGGRLVIETMHRDRLVRTFREQDWRLLGAGRLLLEQRTFDAALNLFTSLGYLGDDEDTRMLAQVGRVLRPGARLVIETMHRDLLVRRFQEQDWQMVGEGRLLLEQRTFDPGAGVTQTTQTLIDNTGERESRTFSVRVYTATELVAMLLQAGFAEAKCYGDLDGAPFGTDTRLVIVARGRQYATEAR